MNICVIPAYQRPEYLKECLTNIEKADGADEQLYMVCLDHGYWEHNITVINESYLKKYINICKTEKTNYKLGKQSYNVLKWLVAVSNHKDVDIIHYIEDDIMISQDYFTFARDIFKQQPDIFAYCGTKSDNLPVKTSDDVNAYYLTDKADFQTHGDSYNARLFNKFVAPHFNTSYFNNPVAYCQINFNGSKVGKPFVEQDGLIRRIIEQNKLLLAYGHVPRCQHSGIYGYNRQAEVMHKSYEEKLAFIRATVYDPEKMKQYDRYNDSEPCNMNLSHTEVYLKPV